MMDFAKRLLPPGLALLVLASYCSSLASAQYPVTQEAYIKSVPAENGALFGRSIAGSGSTIVVGAPDDFGNGEFAGVAYVFELTTGGWMQGARLTHAQPHDQDCFGWDVDIDGDTLVVGCLFHNSSAVGVDGDENDQGAFDAGAAYVFVRTGSGWVQQAFLKASNAGADDLFGVSVAIHGDLIAVGATGEDSDATGVDGNQASDASADSGAVYLFHRSGGSWSQVAYLKPSVTSQDMFVGHGLDVQDGVVAVGATAESGASTGINGDPVPQGVGASGAVYIFEESGGAWNQTAYLKASNASAGARFGYSISLSLPNLAIGAALESTDETGLFGLAPGLGGILSGGAGAAYLFSRNGGAWSEDLYIKPINGHRIQSFGTSCAVNAAGDLLAIGAVGDSVAGTGVNPPSAVNWTFPPPAPDSGAVFVYRKNAGVWSQDAYLKASNSEAHDQFGTSVLLLDDHLLVGASKEESLSSGIDGTQLNGGFEVGALYDFDLDGPDAATFIRTQGSNPMAYSSTLPQIGTSIALTVDLATSGHAAALLTCFKRPTSIGPFLNGQWILAGPHFPAGEIFGLAPLAGGPSVTASIAIPDAPILVGEVLHTQAFLFGGGLNWSASNAIRLTLGN